MSYLLCMIHIFYSPYIFMMKLIIVFLSGRVAVDTIHVFEGKYFTVRSNLLDDLSDKWRKINFHYILPR
jgi:hypothetical protein